VCVCACVCFVCVGVCGWVNVFYPKYTYKKKRKDVKSQSKQNIICAQTSYVFWLYIAILG